MAQHGAQVVDISTMPSSFSAGRLHVRHVIAGRERGLETWIKNVKGPSGVVSIRESGAAARGMCAIESYEVKRTGDEKQGRK